MTLKARLNEILAYNPTLNFGETNRDAFNMLFTICYNASIPKYSGAARYLYKNVKRITFNPTSNQVGFTTRRPSTKKSSVYTIDFYQKNPDRHWTFTIDMSDEPIKLINITTASDTEQPMTDEDWIRRIQQRTSNPLPTDTWDLYNYLVEACTAYRKFMKPEFARALDSSYLYIADFISEEIEVIYYDQESNAIHFSPKSPVLKWKENDSGFREVSFDPDIRNTNQRPITLQFDLNGRFIRFLDYIVPKLQYPEIRNEKNEQ